MRTMFDAAVPQQASLIESFDVAGGYIGYQGATPHVWSKADWDSQPCRFRFPIFVPSWWANLGWDTVRDVQAAAGALAALGVPQGSTIGLDMETRVQPSYVSLFIKGMNARGYPVLVYGSLAYVVQNPLPSNSQSGYWPADWNGEAHLVDAIRLATLRLSTSYAPFIMATQYGSKQGNGVDFDLNLISEAVPLWDTQTGNATMSLELNTPVPASPAMVQRYPDIAGLGYDPGQAPPFGTVISWMGARVAHIANKVDSGVPIIGAAPSGGTLSDADVQRIARAVAVELGKDISNG